MRGLGKTVRREAGRGILLYTDIPILICLYEVDLDDVPERFGKSRFFDCKY